MLYTHFVAKKSNNKKTPKCSMWVSNKDKLFWAFYVQTEFAVIWANDIWVLTHVYTRFALGLI